MKSITVLASAAVCFSLLSGCVVTPDPYYGRYPYRHPLYVQPHATAVYPASYYYSDYYYGNYPYYYPASTVSVGYYGGYYGGYHGWRHGGGYWGHGRGGYGGYHHHR
jgi:hypothetical protein